jgi:hypothetical protein
VQDIKKITADHLAQTKDPTQKGVFIGKEHPEWNDLWSYVYRGVCFSLVSFSSLILSGSSEQVNSGIA